MNNVLVTGSGTIWTNRSEVWTGASSSGNALTIINSGTVFSTTGFIGGSSTSTGNTVLVTDSGSLWYNINNLYVGYPGSGNALIVTNGGAMISGTSYIGYTNSANNNTVLVTGAGSVWTNTGTLYVGYYGSRSSLTIVNSAAVRNAAGHIGYQATSSNNTVVIGGPSSVWTCTTDPTVGYYGSGNSLLITNGGAWYTTDAYIGFKTNANNNTAIVTGSGSVWRVTGGWQVGGSGASNSLTIANGGAIFATGGGYVGYTATSGSNVAVVTGSGSVWTNGANVVVGYYCSVNSLIISNGGVLSNVVGYISYQTNAYNNAVTVTGPGSVWNNGSDLYVGNYGTNNTLTITNGGRVFNSFGYIGYNTNSSNNTVIVTGPGSVWTSTNRVNVGYYGSGNTMTVANGAVLVSVSGVLGYQVSAMSNIAVISGAIWTNTSNGYSGYYGSYNSLIITNGAWVNNGYGYLGYFIESDSNTVLVTGPGSVWTNTAGAWVGNYGSGNALTIANSGTVFSTFGYIGIRWSANDNKVLVTDTGSVWNNSTNLYVGSSGYDNKLTITNGGKVFNATGYVGYDTNANNNAVVVTGSGSVWSNRGDLYVGNLGSDNSLTITNSGVVFANNMVAGDGTHVATVNLRGGSLAVAGLATIQNNSALSGNGTISGVALVNGLVQADTGSGLTFLNAVTNNAVIRAIAGAPIVFNAAVVNNGLMDANAGSFVFNGGVINNGAIVSNGMMAAFFTANPTNGPAPLVVTFSDSSAGAVTNRFWDFGDGTTTNLTDTAIAHTYSTTGTCTAILIVSGSAGVSTNTRLNYINIVGMDTTVATWINGSASGNWSDASSWSPTWVPDNAATVVFGTGGSTCIVDSVSRLVTNLVFNRTADFVLAASGGAQLTINAGITATGSAAYAITAPLALGSNNVWDISANSSLTIGGTLTGAVQVTKIGGGTVTFSNSTISIGGALRMDGGTVMMNGSSYTSTTATVGDTLGDVAGQFATLILTNGAVYNKPNNWLNVGYASGSTGVVIMSSGTLTSSGINMGRTSYTAGAIYQDAGTIYAANEFDVGYQNGAYGFYQMTGGVLSNGTYFQVGRTSSMGLMYQSGGFITNATTGVTLGYGVATAVVYMTSGAMFTPVVYMNRAAGGRAELNLAGGNLTVGGNLTLNQATGTNIVNLLAGTAQVNRVTKNVAGGLSIFNFDGGTLRAGSNNVVLMGGGNLLDAAYVYGGNAIIDSYTNRVTIAQPLLAPGGYGVTNINFNGPLAGYIGAPYVGINGGSGTGATAVALFDYTSGSVTGILVTSRGAGYQSGDTVTARLIGGGGTNATFSTVLGANISGGLTKLGVGTLVLSNINTYTGSTFVSNGTLALISGATIGNSPTITLASGATFDVSGRTGGGMTLLGSQTLRGGGTITGNLINQGTIIADVASGQLAFTGTVTNNGSIFATNGAMLVFYAPVVNNGTIDATAGNAAFYGGVTGGGTLLGPAPTASFSGTPTNGIAPLSVTFTDTSIGAITNRYWDFGDGLTTNTSATTVGHNYFGVGSFEVRLIVSSTGGSSTNAQSNYITVSSPTSITWTNANASGNWSDANSWFPASVPDNADTVVFGLAGSTCVVDNVSRTVTNLVFNRGTNFVVAASGGAQLTVVGTITVASNNTYVLATPVVLGGTNTWTVNSGTLTAAGIVTGSNSLGIAGSGTVNLSVSNAHTGGTMLNGGTLILSNNAAIGSGPLYLNGGQIRSASGTNAFVTSTTLFGADTTIASGGGTLTFAGPFILTNGTHVLTVLGNTVISGTISDNGLGYAFIKNGNVNMVFSGTNTYSGPTIVTGNGGIRANNSFALGVSGVVTAGFDGAAGKILLGDGVTMSNITLYNFNDVYGLGGGLQVPSGSATWAGPIVICVNAARVSGNTGTLTITGPITDNGSNFVVRFRVGTVILSNTNNNWGGTTMFSVGLFVLGANNAIPTNTTASMADSEGGTTLDMAGFNQQFAGLVRALTNYPAVLTNSSPTLSTLTMNVPASTNNYYDGHVIGNLAIVKTGPGTFTLAGTNTYTGFTRIDSGTLALSGTATITNSPAITLASVATFDVSARTGGGLTLVSAQTLHGAGTITGNLINQGIIMADVASGQLAFTGTVTNNASILASNGATLVFYGPVVNNGLVDATAGSVAFNGGLINNGTIATNGMIAAYFTASPTNGLMPLFVTFTDSSAGSITNRYWDFGDGGTTNVSATSVTHTYSAVGNFTVSLIVSGTSGISTNTRLNYITATPPTSVTWTNAGASGNWSDASSWSPTWVPDNAATVVFGTGGSTCIVDTVSRLVTNLVFNRNADFVLAASGGAQLTLNAGITATGTAAYAITAPLALSSNNVWNIGANSSLSIGGTVTGAVPLTKYGSGTLTISGSLQITNGTVGIVINDGTVNITGTNIWLGSGSAYDSWYLRSNAVLNISGYFYSVARLRIGYYAGMTSIVNQTDGTVVLGGDYGLLIANTGAGNVGIYNLYGGTLTLSNRLTLAVNNYTVGIFNMTNGTLSVGGPLEVGRQSGGPLAGTTNYFYQSGGVATIKTLTMGRNSSDSPSQFMYLSISNGVFSVTNNFNYLGPNTNQTAYLYLGPGANVTLPPFPTARGVSSTATITFDGATLTPSATMSTNNYLGRIDAAYITSNGVNFIAGTGTNVTIVQVLQDSSGQAGVLRKFGSGTLTLSSNSTYTGFTLIAAGTLALTNNGSIGNSPTITMASGTTFDVSGRSGGGMTLLGSQTLRGAGTITGNLINQGTIIADVASGQLAFTGTVTNDGSISATNGATLVFDGPVVNNGLIDATAGSVAFNGSLINNGTIVTNVPPAADLTVSQFAAPLPATANNPLTYFIAITNLGPTAATSVTITDALPSGVTFLAASTTPGSCVTDAVNNVIANIGSLALGAGATVQCTVRLPGVMPANYTNTLTVTGTETDPNPANNTSLLVSSVALDSVGDGIPNWWRQLYFGGYGTQTNALSAATADPDGDGFSNLQEFLAGTDPRNAASALRIRDAGVTFDTMTNKLYRVEFTNDLLAGSWSNLTATAVIGTGSAVTVPDPGASGQSRRFYRVRLVPVP